MEPSICHGITDEPKSVAAKAPVPVIGPLKKILNEYRARCGNPESGFLFPTRTGKSVSLNNVLYREILPVLKGDASLPPWRGGHGFRRGLATKLHDLGVDDLTIQ